MEGQIVEIYLCNISVTLSNIDLHSYLSRIVIVASSKKYVKVLKPTLFGGLIPKLVYRAYLQFLATGVHFKAKVPVNRFNKDEHASLNLCVHTGTGAIKVF